MTNNPQEPPATAMEIANWFLVAGWKERKYGCDQLKLNKLVYYAHAWHLGNDAGPLFSETVEAWPHGPIVPELYHAFKDAGRLPIKSLGSGSVYSGELEGYLKDIWEHYKEHSGISLSNSTHAQGEPWSVVAQKKAVNDTPIIPNDIIEKVFRKKVEKILSEEI